MDDAGLVEGIRSGDQTAWTELVDRHSPVLWRLARSVVDDDDMASDAMQSAWLAFLQSLDRLDQPQAALSWLMTTTRREAIALSKARSRQHASDPLEWSFDAPTEARDDPGEQVAAADQNRQVLSAFRTLSSRCQELLTMLAHRIEYQMIASMMEMAVGSIGPTKGRCLDELRRTPTVARLEAAT